MKHVPILVVAAAIAAFFVMARAQSTQPSSAERLEQTAKDFGITPEKLEKFVSEELGDPVVVEGDLAIGVHRNADGHVKTINISTPKRSLEFNVQPEEGRPGLQYIGGGIAPGVPFASATDIDGDVRVDQIIFRHSAGEDPAASLLLRIGDRFVPATALGHGRFKLNDDGRTMKFDRATHEWLEAR
jgi:hypothetical protein